jgi:hypothetical protein
MAILNRIIGPIIGLIFGLVFFWQGVGAAFAVMGFILVGWLIGLVSTGKVDLIGWLYNRTRRPRLASDSRMDTLVRR